MSGASTISPIKGYTIRGTKTDNCGRPLEGAANRIVTKGFVKVMLDPDIVAAEELEKKNAEGKVCVSSRTPPELKRHKVTLEVCGVNPDLYSLAMEYERILDYDGTPIGIADQTEIASTGGLFIEVWTGVGDEEECDDTPTDDSIFSQAAAGPKYGYLAFLSTEWVPSSGISVQASPSDFTLTGITKKAPGWGRGPYNVARINADGDAGRLLVPYGKKRHMMLFKTPIAPPEPTDGAVALAVKSIFTAEDELFYFGGPANEPAVDIAPDQIDGLTTTVTITGGPSGGNFTLLLNGLPTGTINHNAANSAVELALVGIDDGITAANIDVTGNSGGPWTIKHPFGSTIAVGTNSLSGGEDPAIELS